MTHYERSMKWIDLMFKRYFLVGMNLEGIFELIEAKRSEQVKDGATGRAFDKALREYKAAAFKAYPDRRRK